MHLFLDWSSLMIQIRKATESDSQSLAELNQAFNSANRPSDQIRRVLQTSGATETVLVAEESGAVVGFACFQTLHSICYDSPWTEITELYVTRRLFHRLCRDPHAVPSRSETRADPNTTRQG